MEVSCVQVSQIEKHSSCERFEFCKFCEGHGALNLQSKRLAASPKAVQRQNSELARHCA